MTAAPPTAATVEAAPPWARPLFELQIDMLGKMAEAGLEMALDVRDEARAVKLEGSPEPAVLEGLARAFGRTSRAVRLTLMLQARLIDGLVTFDARGAAPAPAAPDRELRIVRIIVDPRNGDVEDPEDLPAEMRERLDQEAPDTDPLPRRMAEVSGTPVETPNSSPIGGGGPDEALAKSGGGGRPEAAAGQDQTPSAVHITRREASP